MPLQTETSLQKQTFCESKYTRSLKSMKYIYSVKLNKEPCFKEYYGKGVLLRKEPGQLER